jgi:hypothetical protein
MWQLVLTLVLGTIVVAPPALAQSVAEPKGLDAAFGNTVRAHFPDGQIQRFWLKADNTWAGAGRTGRDNRGRWKFAHGEVCLTNQRRSVFCLPVPPQAQVGYSWTAEVHGRYWGVVPGSDVVTLDVVGGIEPYSPTPPR